MGKAHVLAILHALRTAVEARGFVLAVTSSQTSWKTTARVYRSERDKGKPERAVYETTSFNRWTVEDAVGAIDYPDRPDPRLRIAHAEWMEPRRTEITGLTDAIKHLSPNTNE